METEEKYKIVQNNYKGKKNHILDIGCLDGSFLILAKRNGWGIPVGVESKESLYKKAIINISECCIGEFSDVELSFDKYNVITYWDLFNKIKDPMYVLTKIKDLMSNNSMCFIYLSNTINNDFEYVYSKEGIDYLFLKADIKIKTVIDKKEGFVVIGVEE